MSTRNKPAPKADADASMKKIQDAPNVTDLTDEREHMREDAFFEAQHKLLSAKNFNDFKQICTELEQSFKYMVPEPKSENALKCHLDLKACDLYPSDGPDQFLPRKTKGDGNCAFNSGSILTWGTTHYATELRVRTCIELALHEDDYTNHSFLSNGMAGAREVSDNLPKYYAQFLENYTMSMLTENEIKRLFR